MDRSENRLLERDVRPAKDEREAGVVTDALFHGSLALPYFGVSLFVAWVFLALYSPTFDFLPSPYAESETSAYLWSVAFLVATLLAVAVQTKALVDFFSRKLVLTGAVLAMALGTVFYAYGFRSFGSPWDVVGGAFTGVSSAVVASLWVYEFSGVQLKSLLANLQWLVVSSIVLCLTLLYLPEGASLAAVVLLPMASGVCLASVNGRRGEDIGIQKGLSDGRWLVYVCIAAIVGVVGLASGIFNGGASSSESGYSLATLFGLLVLAALFSLAGVYAYVKNRGSLVASYVVPTVVLVLVLVPSSQNIAGQPSVAFVAMGENLGEICLEVSLVVLSAAFARYLNVGAVRLFCVTRISMAVFDIVGYAVLPSVGFNLSGAGFADQFSMLAVLLSVELLATVLLGVMLMKRHDLVAAGPADAGKSSGAGEEPGQAAVARDAASDEAGAGDLLRERCLQIKDEFDLSSRELDVLVLLSKGYSSSAIQETLYIAPGTVNSHTRNIYSKLGVHSKSEIIKLVESWPPM